MPLNIVLIEPEIPNNTGNIGRLALATGSRLHLIIVAAIFRIPMDAMDALVIRS